MSNLLIIPAFAIVFILIFVYWKIGECARDQKDDNLNNMLK